MQLKIHTVALLLTAFLAAGCNAQSKAKTKLEPVEIEVVTTLEPGFQERLWSYPQPTRKHLMKVFDEIAIDGKVTMIDITRRTTVYDSGLRGRLIGGILTLDLDGNMELSEDEMARFDEPDYTRWMSGHVKARIPFSEMDADEDGTVTNTELQLFAREFARDQGIFFERESSLHLMVFDEDGDGILTKDELTKSFDRHIDSTSRVKREAAPDPPVLSKADQKKQTALDERCVPEVLPAQDNDIVMLSGGGGTVVSSVAVASQDTVTQVTRLEIEPGNHKLYIMVSANSDRIWSVEGDTNRVAGFVASTGRQPGFAGAGVVGLDRDDVAFIPHECMGAFQQAISEPAIISSTRYERIFDREIDNIISNHRLSTVSLPSGDIMDLKTAVARTRKIKTDGGKSDLAKNGISFSLIGNSKYDETLATIPLDKVVSPAPLEDYEIYPSRTGLMRLISEGKIEKLDRNTYYIKETFPRFPAGIRVKFILGEGVAFPRGTVGNSSVRSEETGKCLIGICY